MKDIPKYESKLTFSVRIKMQPITRKTSAKNMNQGALFFDRFELFIHDFNDPIQGPIARFTPSFAQKNFQCEDLESRQRVRNIMYGFQPYGSFMTKFKSKQQVLEDFKRRYKELV